MTKTSSKKGAVGIGCLVLVFVPIILLAGLVLSLQAYTYFNPQPRDPDHVYVTNDRTLAPKPAGIGDAGYLRPGVEIYKDDAALETRTKALINHDTDYKGVSICADETKILVIGLPFQYAGEFAEIRILSGDLKGVTGLVLRADISKR